MPKRLQNIKPVKRERRAKENAFCTVKIFLFKSYKTRKPGIQEHIFSLFVFVYINEVTTLLSYWQSLLGFPLMETVNRHYSQSEYEMNNWSNISIIGVECSLLSTSVKELTHGMLSPKISLTKPGRKKSSIFSKAISVLNISHNKKMNTIFIHNFFFRFNTLELKRKEIYWPIVISFLPLALQRRIVKLFLLNQNWKNIRYSQIENFLAIQKNFSSHYLIP